MKEKERKDAQEIIKKLKNAKETNKNKSIIRLDKKNNRTPISREISNKIKNSRVSRAKYRLEMLRLAAEKARNKKK